MNSSSHSFRSRCWHADKHGEGCRTILVLLHARCVEHETIPTIAISVPSTRADRRSVAARGKELKERRIKDTTFFSLFHSVIKLSVKSVRGTLHSDISKKRSKNAFRAFYLRTNVLSRYGKIIKCRYFAGDTSTRVDPW